MKQLIIGSLLILGSISDYSEPNQSNGTLVLEITGIDDKGGVMMIAVFKEDDKFLKEPSYAEEVSINEESNITVKFNNIPFDTYAISIYHDLNENGELDSNFIKIPKEPIGFSNEYFPKFGPPKFKNASFILNQNELKMNVNLETY